MQLVHFSHYPSKSKLRNRSPLTGIQSLLAGRVSRSRSEARTAGAGGAAAAAVAPGGNADIMILFFFLN